MEIENIKAKVYYYNLEFKFRSGENLSRFFDTLTDLSKTRARIRYQYFGARYIYIQGISNKDKIIMGKLRSIRDDIFPQLINMTSDEVTDLESSGNDGVMDTAHFIIDYRSATPVLALEYSHSGAKIDDFVNYMERIGINKDLIDSMAFRPLTDEKMSDLKERLNRVSQFSLKIHKSNLDKLEGMDKGILQSAEATVRHFENEYAVLDFKFDYRSFTDTPLIKKSILGLIKWFEDNPDKKNLFNYMSFKAEDELHNNKLRFFDLIISKEKSEITVQKKRKAKTIISEDMFPKMLAELNLKGFR